VRPRLLHPLSPELEKHINGLVLYTSSSGEHRVAASSVHSATVTVWSSETGETLAKVEGLEEFVYCLATFQTPGDNRPCIASGGGNDIRIFDGDTYETRHVMMGQGSEITKLVAYSSPPIGPEPAGVRLVSADEELRVIVWDALAGVELRRLSLTQEATPAQTLVLTYTAITVMIAFESSGAPRLAAGTMRGDAIVWDPENGDHLFTTRAHTGSIWSLSPFESVLPTARPCLLSASDDSTAKVMSPPSHNKR
jgi:WD40 repeat protein